MNKTRHIIGLMSGTSVDAIDAALVRVSGPPEHPAVRLLAFVTLPYPSAVRRRLLQVASGENTTLPIPSLPVVGNTFSSGYR